MVVGLLLSEQKVQNKNEECEIEKGKGENCIKKTGLKVIKIGCEDTDNRYNEL